MSTLRAGRWVVRETRRGWMGGPVMSYVGDTRRCWGVLGECSLDGDCCIGWVGLGVVAK